ncbi:hypothetical protein CKO14_09520 [Halorhodospira halophila]|nr:hypothetical protein [Halorhodospira halophila]
MVASAQDHSWPYGGTAGDREFSISGTGISDKNLDSSSFGASADIGWYLRDPLIVGARQSVNYASIEGESIKDDFWNGTTRGYLNYQFAPSERMRPFLGGSLGVIYGDGVKDSGFAGLELGGKYYVREKTYLLGRVEYQWLFSSSSDVDDAFRDDGAWAYTLGMGYNF